MEFFSLFSKVFFNIAITVGLALRFRREIWENVGGKIVASGVSGRRMISAA